MIQSNGHWEGPSECVGPCDLAYLKAIPCPSYFLIFPSLLPVQPRLA